MGLLGGMARTAVAAGTWTAVSNRVSRRQANRWAQQDQQQYYEQQPQQYYQEPAAAAAAPTAAVPANGGRDRIDQLKELADLKAQGVLSDQEFASEKARILGT
jgi:transcription initiation factor TFIID subunit TAF12